MAVLAGCIAAGGVGRVWAQDGEAPAPSSAEERAKELFFRANALREAGEYGAALELYLESRDLSPNVANTQNAAVCLDRLERYDEALELYVVLLRDFGSDLDEETATAIKTDASRLRSKTGSIEVSANVKGQLIVDGRPRGELPRRTPVRVLPGARDIRVMASGYETFRKEVEVKEGQALRLEAELKRLTNAGQLRVEGDDLDGATIFVDGGPVGQLPWEGTLATGAHYVMLVLGDRGTGPQSVTIVDGQTALLRPKLQPLGPALRIVGEPSSAELTLDATALNASSFAGRLPLGVHELRLSAEGYLPLAKTVEVTPEGPREITLALKIDPEHPMWAEDEPSVLSIEAFGGFAIAPSFGSGAEESCSRDGFECGSTGLGLGPFVGGRLGYELPFRLSLQVAGGFALADKSFSRSVAGTLNSGGTSVPVTYDLEDDLRFTGGFIAAGLGYRLPLTGPLEFQANVLAGVMFAGGRDVVRGTVTDGDRTVDLLVDGDSDRFARKPDFFVLPEARLGLRFDGFFGGVGVSVPIFTLAGPDGNVGPLRVDNEPCQTGAVPATDVSCLPADDAIGGGEAPGERPFGAFLAVVPGIYAGYAFSL